MRKKVILACTNCGSRNYSYKSNKAARQNDLEIKNFVKHAMLIQFIEKQNSIYIDRQ